MLARIRKLDGLDLTQPGAVDELLAAHRAIFGSARMDAGDGDGEEDGDGDGDEGDGKPTAKKAAAKKTAKKAAAKSGEDGDGDDDADESEVEKQQKALTEERRKVSSSVGLIAKLTGKSKTEVSRALRKGGDALTALESADDGDDGDDGDGKPPAKKTAAKRTEAEIRREAERVADERVNSRLVRAEVRALAAETFANPSDALHNLENLDDYDLDDDGELVDKDRVRTDLAAVLTKHPHYAAKKKGPKADRSQGGRGGGSARPKSMRELSRMSVDDD